MEPIVSTGTAAAAGLLLFRQAATAVAYTRAQLGYTDRSSLFSRLCTGHRVLEVSHRRALPAAPSAPRPSASAAGRWGRERDGATDTSQQGYTTPRSTVRAPRFEPAPAMRIHADEVTS